MPNMRTAFGTDWSGSFDSVAVGPKATVTVYDNENYQQRVAQFKPGERIPDLGDRVGFFEDIRSLRIFCSGRQQASQDAGFGTTSAQQASGVAPGGSTSAGSENRKDRFTRLDTNGDGSISRSEWTASAGS
jgi:hypothetical protein